MCHRQQEFTNTSAGAHAGTRQTVPFHRPTLIANRENPRASPHPSPPRKRGPIPVLSVIPAKAGTHSPRHVPPPTGIHKHISGCPRRNAANRSLPSTNPDREPRKSPRLSSPVSPAKAGAHPPPIRHSGESRNPSAASPTKTNARPSLSAGIAPLVTPPFDSHKTYVLSFPHRHPTGGPERRYPRRQPLSRGAHRRTLPQEERFAACIQNHSWHAMVMRSQKAVDPI